MFRSLVASSSKTVRTTRLPVRTFSVSARSAKSYPEDLSTNAKTKTDQYPDDKHAINKVKKGDTHDVQSSNMKSGLDANKGSAHNNGNGGHATERQDSAGGKEKAKKEFPEAPDVAIGMQDERGGRGA